MSLERDALIAARDALAVAQEVIAAALARVEALPPLAPPAAPPVVSRALAESDYAAAAARLDVPVTVVQAVAEVESGRDGGFDSAGRPTVLFEPHKFSEFTGHRFDKTHGGVSYPRWGQKPYPTGTADERNQKNWDKILFAAELPGAREAAYLSASYGRFQIMGFNWQVCGYANLDAFLEAMWRSEGDHLQAFCGFIEHNNLARHLRAGNWQAFARGYNGSGQAAKYGGLIGAAVARLSA